MQAYEASQVDSLKPLVYIHSGALRAQIPTRGRGVSRQQENARPPWTPLGPQA